jgi:uncharacterized protein (DUF2267 family)
MPTAADHPDVLEHGVERTRRWIEETAAELGTDDMLPASRTLKAVLHAIRDRIAATEAPHLAAELPERLRWAFYEHWDPSGVPLTYRDRDEFLRRVAEEARLASAMEASFAVFCVMTVMCRHLSAEEIEHISRALPAELRGVSPDRRR